MSKVRYLAKLFLDGFLSIAAALALVLAALLFLAGICVVVDIYQDPHLPEPHWLSDRDRMLARCEGTDIVVVRYRALHWLNDDEGFERLQNVLNGHPENDADRWDELQIPLAYLRRTTPAVADWVSSRHQESKLIWVSEPRDYIAATQTATNTLLIHDSFFYFDDYKRASILAHEFRHSRQGILATVQQALAFILQHPRKDLVEEQAEAYERLVYDAIRYGR